MALVQCLFYTAAVVGFIAERCGVRPRIFYIPFYFVFANAAIVLAFMQWLQGKTYSMWAPTERVSPDFASASRTVSRTMSTGERSGGRG